MGGWVQPGGWGVRRRWLFSRNSLSVSMCVVSMYVCRFACMHVCSVIAAHRRSSPLIAAQSRSTPLKAAQSRSSPLKAAHRR